MPRIFISYRRQDSGDIAGRISDHLETEFGRENVFEDVDSIPPGVDFREFLQEAVARCDILLVVIGRDWLDVCDESGHRRLDNEADYVRIEIEAALARAIPLVPVLVREAMMARAAELPVSLQDLAFRNAVRVRPDPDFRRDMHRVILGLKRLFPPPEPPGPESGEVITNSIGMKLVLIPAGEFLMGSPDSYTDARCNEKPQHRVSITKPFYFGIYPVTQEQYDRVMGTNPSYFSNPGDREDDAAGRDTRHHPVEKLSWNDAVEFCRRLSALAEQKAGGHVYRLPTEAEWEYACRAGSTTKWCFGDDCSQLCDYAWFRENSGDATFPVGQKRANAWGLYDMHGNVWEWCADTWHDGYRDTPADGSAWECGGTPHRVVRGGSWHEPPDICRSAIRLKFAPAEGEDYVGFRVALASPGIRAATDGVRNGQ